MTPPRSLVRRQTYYGTSLLKARTRHHGFIQVATPDQPLYLRTRSGWVEYPGPQPMKVRTRSGWVDAVT